MLPAQKINASMPIATFTSANTVYRLERHDLRLEEHHLRLGQIAERRPLRRHDAKQLGRHAVRDQEIGLRGSLDGEEFIVGANGTTLMLRSLPTGA